MPFCNAYYLVGGAGGDWAVRAGGRYTYQFTR
jgi:hypothetical protein